MSSMIIIFSNNCVTTTLAGVLETGIGINSHSFIPRLFHKEINFQSHDNEYFRFLKTQQLKHEKESIPPRRVYRPGGPDARLRRRLLRLRSEAVQCNPVALAQPGPPVREVLLHQSLRLLCRESGESGGSGWKASHLFDDGLSVGYG